MRETGNFLRAFRAFPAALCALALSLLCAGASWAASPDSYMGYVQVTVSGTNVNLRDQPGSKGRVLGRVIKFDDSFGYTGHLISANGEEFYLEDSGLLAEAEPIRDSADNSVWYKLVLRRRADTESLERLDEDERLNYKTPYVNARYLEFLDFNDYGKAELKHYLDDLEWTKQGRPPRFNVGDDLAKVRTFLRDPSDTYRSAKTKFPAKLYLKPDKNSETFTLPQGTAIVDPMAWGEHAGRGMHAYNPLGTHMDAQDRLWYAIIDANSKKVIGWVDYSEYDFNIGVENSDPDGLLSNPSEDDVNKNSKKIFIY